MGVIVEKQQRGKRLRARRRAAHLTQGALSKRAKISITYLSELENGKKEGKLGIWHALSDALMVDYFNLYAGAPELQSPELFHTMMDAHPEYLKASLEEIEKAYGNTDRYLLEGLGITADDRAKLQEQLLDRG